MYVKIKNESNFSIKFIKGVTTLTPLESASLLMHGESAVYKTVAGSTSLYKFQKNSVEELSVPVAAFEAGHIYSFVFSGSSVTVNPDEPEMPVTIAASYAEPASAPSSSDIPVPPFAGREGCFLGRNPLNMERGTDR